MGFSKCNCDKGKLSMVGDILIRDGGPAHTAMAAESFNAGIILGKIHSELQKADLFFFNHEGAMGNHLVQRDQLFPSHFYINSSPSTLPFLSSLNKKSICSLANNHIADFGVSGIHTTRDYLRNVGIHTIGTGIIADIERPLILETKGIKISFLAFTDLLPRKYYAGALAGALDGIFALTKENLLRAIAVAKPHSDIIVVSLHTVADVLAPFSEAPDLTQSRFAKIAAEAGATLVVGHQPHGLQYVEKYKNTLIFHSLGSFIYNPEASNLYPIGHPLHFATQFYGGSILNVYYCRHGATLAGWTPTHCTYEQGHLRVKESGLLKKIKTRSFLLLS